mmetsp:Transcript_6428/g.19107  ORF Transcript_6428/g.19107 Transcript_6428/m.19107 type:complete len:214 (+) Transcript_6428:190-831(+)
MTAQRPPNLRRSNAPSSTRSSCHASWFSHILTAWNVSFSGRWLRSSRPRFIRATTSANSCVPWNGPFSSCQTTSPSAMRAASSGSLSSPHSRTIQASSWALSSRSISRAGLPCPGFIRMSRGPDVKPRFLSSSWGEETPRSMRTPESSTPSGTASARSPKGRWIILKRASLCSSCLATATAAGSTSKAKRRPRGESRDSSAPEWPPRPKVQST